MIISEGDVKKIVLEELLSECDRVMIFVDPRGDYVLVPKECKAKLPLLIALGLNLPIPIPDMILSEDGISATLSFGERFYFCVMPWDSIFGMVKPDNTGPIWPKHIPEELVHKFPVVQDESDYLVSPNGSVREVEKKREPLSSIDGDQKKSGKPIGKLRLVESNEE